MKQVIDMNDEMWRKVKRIMYKSLSGIRSFSLCLSGPQQRIMRIKSAEINNSCW